jgi:hypothetical protein
MSVKSGGSKTQDLIIAFGAISFVSLNFLIWFGFKLCGAGAGRQRKQRKVEAGRVYAVTQQKRAPTDLYHTVQL